MVENLWLNGEIVPSHLARIDPADRGFTLADGLFETMRVQNRHCLWWSDHLARLQAGAVVMAIELPKSFDKLASGAEALIAALPATSQLTALRLTLTRGVATSRSLWPAETGEATLIMTVSNIANSDPPPLRLAVATSVRRNSYSPLAGYKSLNYSEAILARREVATSGANEAIMLNSQGRIACASIGSLFLRIGGGEGEAGVSG